MCVRSLSTSLTVVHVKNEIYTINSQKVDISKKNQLLKKMGEIYSDSLLNLTLPKTLNLTCVVVRKFPTLTIALLNQAAGDGLQ